MKILSTQAKEITLQKLPDLNLSLSDSFRNSFGLDQRCDHQTGQGPADDPVKRDRHRELEGGNPNQFQSISGQEIVVKSLVIM